MRRVLVAGFLAIVLGAAPASADPVEATVNIEKRKVVGERVIRVKQGDQVTLRFNTDEIVELHLHGYDIEREAKPGAGATMSFNARATGRFPVTSHGFGGHSHGHHESALFYIEVHPR